MPKLVPSECIDHGRGVGPVAITATVSGTGAGSTGGQSVAFDPGQHLQRPGLLLASQVVYVAFGSHGDESPWHGWVMSYNASDLIVQLGVFMTTPDGDGGAVWQSGHGLAADDAGNVYCISGNGDYDGSENFGESLIKLSGPGVALLDWFTPENWQMLSDSDSDLSAGPALIPGTHTMVGGDKYGQLYLINGDSMGELGSASSVGTQIFTGAVLGGCSILPCGIARTLLMSMLRANRMLSSPTGSREAYSIPRRFRKAR